MEKIEIIKNILIQYNSNNSNNSKINFNDSIYKNIKSKKHVLTQIGLIGIEALVGVTLFSNPLAFTLGAINIFVFGTNFIIDKNNEKKTLINNMKKFKKIFDIRFEGITTNIKEIIYKIYNDIVKEIDNYVDSQNSDFRGIKAKKVEFDNICENFKKIYYEENDL